MNSLKFTNLKIVVTFIFFFLSTSGFSFQKIEWQTCADNPEFQCGLLTVPENYKNPEANFIQLPVTLYRTQGTKLGTLIFNAGGPWYDDVASLHGLFQELSSTIKEHFDLASFTPRGVTPNSINCHSDQMNLVHEIDRELNLSDLNSEEGAQNIYSLVVRKRNLCHYDSLYQQANTRNTVQDLEELRKALDVDKINYLSGSYGTRLGLAYLAYYPQNVNNMVLDGNVAPNNDLSSFIHGVAPAMEDTLHQFFKLCEQSGTKCPLYRSSPQEIQHAFQRLMSEAGTSGLPTTSAYDNRPLSSAMLMNVVISALSAQGAWPFLANALNQAITNDSADLLMSFYMYTSGYDPKTDTFNRYNDTSTFDAVYCTDYFISQELQEERNWLAAVRNLRTQYPLSGGAWATYFAKECIAWPVESEPLLPESIIPNRAVDPSVLLVSNAFDPITSLAWSNEVGEYLKRSHITNKILTWGGAGHLAYHANSPRNGCIDKNVDQFFITGKLPATDFCDDQTNPFAQNNRDESVRPNKLGVVRGLLPAMNY
jgi:pimeloyl-ACP methyl ester carboxylesterase